jgi:hypothetical protein
MIQPLKIRKEKKKGRNKSGADELFHFFVGVQISFFQGHLLMGPMLISLLVPNRQYMVTPTKEVL